MAADNTLIMATSPSYSSLSAEQKHGPTRIVFVGCGIVGRMALEATMGKLPKADYTLIDTKNYFENIVGLARSVVVPDFFPKTSIAHASWLPTNVRLIIGYATQVTKENTIIVNTNSNGTGVNTIIPFDYLVIQTGINWPISRSPASSLDTRIVDMSQSTNRVKEAKSILVIGGGQVGLEVASEVAAEYPGKRVTIVHPHGQFVPAAPVKLHNKIAAWLHENKVTTILNDRVIIDPLPSSSSTDEKKVAASDAVVPLEMKTYRTQKGATIEADFVFHCTGHRYNSQLMMAHFASSLTPKGQIKVSNTFMVHGTTNIFAVGDISDADPCPLAGVGKRHAPILAANLRTLVNARETGGHSGNVSLKTYGGGRHRWGPGTSMGPHVMIVCVPILCTTLVVNVSGSIKTHHMLRKPAPLVKNPRAC